MGVLARSTGEWLMLEVRLSLGLEPGVRTDLSRSVSIGQLLGVEEEEEGVWSGVVVGVAPADLSVGVPTVNPELADAAAFC